MFVYVDFLFIGICVFVIKWITLFPEIYLTPYGNLPDSFENIFFQMSGSICMNVSTEYCVPLTLYTCCMLYAEVVFCTNICSDSNCWRLFLSCRHLNIIGLMVCTLNLLFGWVFYFVGILLYERSSLLNLCFSILLTFWSIRSFKCKNGFFVFYLLVLLFLGYGKRLFFCVLYRLVRSGILGILGYILSITVSWMNVLLLFVFLPPPRSYIP